MAKLHRLVKAEDRQNTHVFTFILPLSIASDNAKDIISPEFMCGNQKWNVSFTKEEKASHVGAYLTIKNPSPGLYVTADYGFTLLNKGHYTANESFQEAAKVFNKQQPTQGRKAFASVNDLKNPARGFLMEKDLLYVEVMLCNFKTYFEYQLQLPLTEKDRQKYPPNDLRLETGFFPFGGAEWNVNVKINERNPTDVRGGSAISLRRLANFDHYCKFRYRLHIGQIEPTPLPGTQPVPKPLHNPRSNVIVSNEMDSLFIDADTQDKLVLPTNIYKLATIKGVITVKVECYHATTLTLLQIPMDRNRHRALRCYDRDKQAWLFEAHMKSDKLKFYVFYGDIATIPRGCLRVVSIGVSVLPAYGNVKLVKAINSPYTRYYIQRQQDDFGLEIPTGIAMKDIIDTQSIYIYDNTNSLTVQIEWGDSYLLKETDYNTTDNVARLHKMQMDREMKMLQKENLILEKQVHSYQTAIAQKDSKGEFDPNQIRPQPTGQAQPGYMERNATGMMDPYSNSRMGPNSMGPGGMAPSVIGPGGIGPDGMALGTMGPGGIAPGGLVQSGMTPGGLPHGTMSNAGMGPGGIVPGGIGPGGMGPGGMGPGGIVPGGIGPGGMGPGGMGPGGMGPGSMGPQGQMIGGSRLTGNDVGYANSPYGRNDLGSMDPYDRQSRGYGPDGSLPVPADRGPRSRSADPNSGSPYTSPIPERRPNRRNSTTGAEYADYLEQTPHSRHNRTMNSDRNYDGYRSDSGYRSDTMGKADPRFDQYTKDGRPRPNIRGGKGSDSRSDFGDYYSERRSKQSYERDIDAYSDRSHKSSGGRSARMSNDRRSMLTSATPTGRASYAGYEGDYIPPDSARGSSYPNTPRTGPSMTTNTSDYPQRMTNGPI